MGGHRGGDDGASASRCWAAGMATGWRSTPRLLRSGALFGLGVAFVLALNFVIGARLPRQLPILLAIGVGALDAPGVIGLDR
jgi:hypothetical protein